MGQWVLIGNVDFALFQPLSTLGRRDARLSYFFTGRTIQRETEREEMHRANLCACMYVTCREMEALVLERNKCSEIVESLVGLIH